MNYFSCLKISHCSRTVIRGCSQHISTWPPSNTGDGNCVRWMMSLISKQILLERASSKVFIIFDRRRSYILIFLSRPLEASRFASVGQTSIQCDKPVERCSIKEHSKQIRTALIFRLKKLIKNIRKIENDSIYFCQVELDPCKSVFVSRYQ